VRIVIINRFSGHAFHRRDAFVVDRLPDDDRPGSPDLGVRAQPRAQPLERHVGGAGEFGGCRTRGGVHNHALGHRLVGRASQLHTRGHVVDAGGAANGP